MGTCLGLGERGGGVGMFWSERLSDGLMALDLLRLGDRRSTALDPLRSGNS